MTTTDVIRALEERGKPNSAEIYARHGVRKPTLGVSFADLGDLVGRIGVDYLRDRAGRR